MSTALERIKDQRDRLHADGSSRSEAKRRATLDAVTGPTELALNAMASRYGAHMCGPTAMRHIAAAFTAAADAWGDLHAQQQLDLRAVLGFLAGQASHVLDPNYQGPRAARNASRPSPLGDAPVSLPHDHDL